MRWAAEVAGTACSIWHGVVMASSFVDSALAAAQRAGVPVDAPAGVECADLDSRLDPWMALGRAFEVSLESEDRTGRGAHFTPPWLARAIVRRVVDAGSGPVVDPACGGGVFLVAALERLVECGVEPRDALTRVVGFDVDHDSLDVAELAARWWAHSHEVPWSDIELIHNDSLLDDVVPEVADLVPVVVGNPPFLDQLDHRSARDHQQRAALRTRFGDDVAAYTDDAGLFLSWAVQLAGSRGRVGMVLPRSALATRDGEGVRRRVDQRSSLGAVWFDEDDTFDAGVRVCVVFTDAASPSTSVEVLRGRPMTSLTRVREPDPDSWSPLLAAAEGVPEVELPGEVVLGGRAEVIAGFRDEYYGLVDAVRESLAESNDPRLVTSGSIDLAELRWATDPVRFAKRRWERPVLDLDAIEGDKVRAWVERLLQPKVLVATQTRVVEAVVDEEGICVGSVPVLNVVANDPGDVWKLAAAIASPPITAWALSRRAGAALSANALKLSATDVRAIPLPLDLNRWSAAAACFGEAQAAATPEARAEALKRFGSTMTEAYGCDARVFEWWQERRG